MGYTALDGQEYDWYNLNIALSRNPSFFFDIGARGIGKTTSFALWARKSWEAKGARWAIVCRRPDEMSLMRENFWNDFTLGGRWDVSFHGIRSLIAEKCPPGVNKKKWRAEHPWQFWGVFLNLSDAIRYKQASQFFSTSKIDKMLFDEFIIEDDSKRYLSTEPAPLFSIASSVFRNRPRRVFCFSNAGFVNNPYFKAYSVTSGDFQKSEYVNPEEGVYFHYSTQPSPAIYSQGITQDEKQYQTQNIFRDVTGSLIGQKPTGATPICNFYVEGSWYVWYRSRYGHLSFIEKKPPAGNVGRFTLDKFDLVESAIFDRDALRALGKKYRHNQLRFDSDESRIVFEDKILI